MKILFLSSEVVPFAKTGGLADVAAALPAALSKLGHDLTIILPAYRDVWRSAAQITDTGIGLEIPMGPKLIKARVLATKLPDSRVEVFLIDQPEFYDRDGLYGDQQGDYPDNCERFAFYQRAALEIVRQLHLKLDLIHCNDWQTALIPTYLRELEALRPNSPLQSTPSLLSIHNIAYQGSFDPRKLHSTGLEKSLFHPGRLEYLGRINFLKAGLIDADALSTVSPTYALEIQTKEYGRGLDAILRERSDFLAGIVNGIDTVAWNPKIDPYIPTQFDVSSWQPGKASCKSELQCLLGLPSRPDVPLLASVGRLDPQKGWDLFVEIGDELLHEDVQLVILGAGDLKLAEGLRALEHRHPDRVRVKIEFSNALAHQIEAGADFFLMPSRYEPCGLNQLYSLAYGTIPIVRATGGLADTVVDANPATLRAGTANGFAFREPSGEAFLKAIKRALAVWTDWETRAKLIRTGMMADWAWHRSARTYAELYGSIVHRRSRSGIPLSS